MDIYPSILETNLPDFEKQFNNVLPFFDHFQIDIADGQFVTNRTVQIEKLEGRNWKLEVGKTFEFHLMVKDYKKEIEKLERLKEKINITLVFIHLQAIALDPSTALRFAQDDGGWKYGLVFNPEDDISSNWSIIKQFSVIQLMTVEPGLQGEPFLPEVINKIDQLRRLGFSGQIILDGGINDKTLPLIVSRANKPDAVCPGSYFKKDVKNRLALLQQIANQT